MLSTRKAPRAELHGVASGPAIVPAAAAVVPSNETLLKPTCELPPPRLSISMADTSALPTDGLKPIVTDPVLVTVYWRMSAVLYGGLTFGLTEGSTTAPLTRMSNVRGTGCDSVLSQARCAKNTFTCVCVPDGTENVQAGLVLVA